MTSIQTRAWWGPWTETDEDSARRLTALLCWQCNIPCDTMDGCEARMTNHLRGVTVRELYAGHADELPAWIRRGLRWRPPMCIGAARPRTP